jgi:hypothetical protein
MDTETSGNQDKSDVGIVGVLDILGYQSIINNNLIEDTAKLISETILNLPNRAIDNIVASLSEKNRSEAIKEFNSIKSLVVSDTIILTMSQGKDGLSFFKWFIFLSYVARLLRDSFDAGFPLRGAIDCGAFFIKGLCFAGRSIINSYNLANRLQFAGCVLTSNAQTSFLEVSKDRKAVADLLVYDYLVPLKTNQEEKSLVVHWFSPFKDWGTIPIDVRQFVYNAFHAHNKDVSRNVLSILENTELVIRFFKTKSEVTT